MSTSIKTKQNASNGLNNGFQIGHEVPQEWIDAVILGNKNIPHSESHKTKQSQGLKRAYSEGRRKPIENIGKWNIGLERSEETRIKGSCTQRGIDIKDFNGFISFEPYTPEFNKEFKNLVRLRDNFCCQLCGMSEQKHLILFGNRLAIHHIDYNKKNTCLVNCISLCTSCHFKTNANRKEWKEYIQEKLKEKYNYLYQEKKEEITNDRKF